MEARRKEAVAMEMDNRGYRKKSTYPCLHIFLGRVWRERIENT
jgi:hypothetical protein